MEVASVAQMRDVPLGAGRQVVEDEHLHAAVEQQLGEVGPDEAGTTRDESAAQGRAMVATETGIMGI